MFRCLACAMILAGLPSTSAPATEKSRWTVDDVVLTEQAAEFQISPDCRWVIWTKSVADKDKGESVTNLVRSSLTEDLEIELTRGPENCSSPKWSPDGRLIAFLTSRPAPKAKPQSTTPEPKPADDEDETKGKPQLWVMNAFGGEPWPVTELARGIVAFDWIDKDTILFAAPESATLFEKTAKEEKKDTSVVVEDELHAPPVRLFRLSVSAKEVTRLSVNQDRIESLTVSPDGRWAVTVHDRSLRFTYDHAIRPAVFLFDTQTGQAKQIFSEPRFNVTRSRWTRDSKGFYAASEFTHHPRYLNATITELHYYDLTSGVSRPVPLDWERGLSHTLSGALPAFDVTGDGFVALLANGARNRPARYRRSGDSWKREWLAGAHTQHLFGLQVGNNDKDLIYVHSTASTPTQSYRARLDSDRIASPVHLTHLNSHLDKKCISRTELVHWKGALDEEVEGVLFYPHGYEPGKKYPLVLMIHGGPAGADMDAWTERTSYAPNLMTERGAFVLKPNYHGSSNYGLPWVESLAGGHYYDLPLEDLEKVVDALIARGMVDGQKLGTLGWSNGAILTVALIVHSPRFKAAAAGAGGAEWVSDWGVCEFGASFNNYYLGKSPLEDPQLYIKMAPFYQFDRVRTPMIIFQGTEDKSVPPHHGWMQYRALQQLGKTDVKLVLFPGEGHALKKLVHQRRKLEEEVAWFDKYLFNSFKSESEALKPDSPLALALKRKAFRQVGVRYGLVEKGHLIPETVMHEKLRVGRFEVTRAQYAEFDKAFVVAAGKENYPANGVSFEKAKAYCSWLSGLTGHTHRLPTQDEAATLYTSAISNENTLDYWAGYAVNPDDASRLRGQLRELGPDKLLKEVGAFKGSGDEDPVFDLGGNVAEWATCKDGKGKVYGGSADAPADPQITDRKPAPEYIGFRVVRGKEPTKQ